MKRQPRRPVIASHLLALVAVSGLATGCGTFDSAKSEPAASKGGAQIWAQNCMRCHNIRSPSPYSDAQWGVITLHMRVRANLTEDEQKAILKFLQSAN